MYSDAIIGVYGWQIKALFSKTGCYVFVPARLNSEGERVFQLSGTYDSVERCQLELVNLLHSCQQYIFGHLSRNQIDEQGVTSFAYSEYKQPADNKQRTKKSSLLEQLVDDKEGVKAEQQRPNLKKENQHFQS